MGACRHGQDLGSRWGRRGVILLVTLVVLVILATLGYTLCAQVAARRHRDQYAIDYSIARQACASGLQYALASVVTLRFDLISRPNEPDFSDLFALPEDRYQQLLAQRAQEVALEDRLARDPARQKAAPEEATQKTSDREALKKGAQDKAAAKAAGTDAQSKSAKKDAAKKAAQKKLKRRTLGGRDANGVPDVNGVPDANSFDPNEGWSTPGKPPQIRGPYGPPWPLVAEPIEFDIGSAHVKIEVEDENAKYPLGWAMMTDEKRKPLAAAGWATFCEWMGYSQDEIGLLSDDLAAISKTKPFKVEFKPEAQTPDMPAATPGKITTRPGPPRGAPVPTPRRVVKKPITVEEQIDRQNKEYAKLLHSSLVNRDLLARQSIESDTRKESALKYLGLWATRQVNVNTAPRQVLEAALTFGSPADAPKIAQAIIQNRREKPVTDVNELKQTVSQYSSAIEDCRTFLTARSSVFTIRVTAVSGVAKVTALAAVSKEGDKVQPIAVISE